MLLFSTDRPDTVQSALSYASRSTGVDFDYLLTTARRESNLDPQARAATSSASGLFQFIESTWLETLKQSGPRYGYADLADRIESTGRGGYQVSDPAARQEILALRHDPKAAALMAGELTRQNSQQLEQALGRAPAAGELYIAHFLGARGATELIRLAETAPQAPAAQHFPAAARANRPIFFSGDGHVRSAREVYANLISRHSGSTTLAAEAEQATSEASAAPMQLEEVFHGLFRDGGQGRGLGPIARTVSAFWTSLFATPAQPGQGASGAAESMDAARSVTPLLLPTDSPDADGAAVVPTAAKEPWRWIDPSLRVS